MSALPGRPDLDQLRRQARELLRAAAASDEEALRRIRVVSREANAVRRPARHRHGSTAFRAGRSCAPRSSAARPAPDRTPTPVAVRRDRGHCRDRARYRIGPEVLAGDARVVRPPAGVAHRPGRSRLERANRRRYPREPSRRASPAQVAVRPGRYRLRPGAVGVGDVRLPGFLVADAEDLIDRQYADRPQLRPIFDAVLAALPALPGPVTVQARGTLVSLVSPRRTFAVLKPTTKSRVDLGLRFDTMNSPKAACFLRGTSARPPSGSRSPRPARWTTRSGPG